MSLIWLGFGCVAFLYAGIKSIYLLSVFFGKSSYREPSHFPHVSVLVAARNEEGNILSCLQSLARSRYPFSKLEILIGNDRSEDYTQEIITEFCRKHPGFFAFEISEDLSNLKGKQNVLAQLAQQAKGELLLVTDADIQVSPLWVSSLVSGLEKNQGMVCGPTLIKGETLFANIQSLDWMMGMGIMFAHDNLGIPITAVGNNMGFTQKAYREVGGYESLPFSITEDYKLFQALVHEKGLPYRQLFHPEALNYSVPQLNFKALFKQRKRWFRGGKEIAFHNKILIFFNAGVVPALLISFFFLSPWETLTLFGFKILADFFFLFSAAFRLKKLKTLIWFPFYEIYYLFMAMLIPINQIMPGKINWKGREY